MCLAVLCAGRRMRATRGVARHVWHVATATSLGGGSWTILVLLLRFSGGEPVALSTIGMSLFSMLIAIAFSGAALVVLERERPGPSVVAMASVFGGLGLSIGKYALLSGVAKTFVATLSPMMVLASLGLSIGLCAALFWRMILRRGTAWSLVTILVGAVLLATAVAIDIGSLGVIGPEAIIDDLRWERAFTIVEAVCFLLSGTVLAAVVDEYVVDRLRRETQRVRASEQRFRLLVDGVRDSALFMLDPEGRVVNWTFGASRLTGYRETEVLEQPFEMFFQEEDVGEGVPAEVLAAARRDWMYHNEGSHKLRTADGIATSMTVNRLDDEAGRLVGYSVLLRDITESLRARMRLEELNDELERKVDQRTAELSEAKALAENANKSKSDFLATMTHELRTPLTAVIGYAELLHQDMLDAENELAASDIERIMRSSRHALRLINEMLDLAKIEAGHMTIRNEPVEIATIAGDLSDTAAPLVAAKHNRFVVSIDCSTTTITTDGQRVSQCLLNLVSNAAKFTENGRVDVRIEDATLGERPAVRFAVTDTGIGMTPEQLSRVFGAFQQAEATTADSYGGTGLGLAIVREFVALLGGELEVASDIGEGTTMAFVIPLKPDPDALQQEQAGVARKWSIT